MLIYLWKQLKIMALLAGTLIIWHTFIQPHFENRLSSSIFQNEISLTNPQIYDGLQQEN